MEKNTRPVRREKNTSAQSGHVHKRGSGLNASGPSGNPQGYQGRPGSTSGSGTNPPGTNAPGTPTQNSGQKPKIPLVLFGILAAAAVIFILPSIMGKLGQGSGGNQLPLSGTQANSPLEAGGANSSKADNGIPADTSVSDKARPKRTAILGNGQDTVTIMVYMCGTDLESRSSMATKDLQEMLAADLGDHINLLVFTGGTKQWNNSTISNSVNEIYLIQDGSMKRQMQTDRLMAMTDPDTLSQFIQWGKSHFPANRYHLIFWDHGGGSASGYGYDEVNTSQGSMTLDLIAQALKNGGCTFDFIGFDACLMATLETALVVEPYADYLIASEETEPGVGWYYTDWLTALGKDPSMPTVELGKKIVDDFVHVSGIQAKRQETTLSVTDLAELSGTVPDAFSQFSQATSKLIEQENYTAVSNARSQAKEFAASSKINQVDLVDLCNRMDTPESRELASVLDSAVKYSRTSENVSNAYGLSIYFPYGSTSSVSKMARTYEKIGLDDSYTKCIKSFASLEVAGQTVAGGNSGQLSSLFGSLLSAGGSYTSQSPANQETVTQQLGQLLSGQGASQVGLDEENSSFLDTEVVENNTEFLTENQFDLSALTWTEENGAQVLKLSEKQWSLIQKIELNVFVDDGEGYIDLGLDNVYDLNESGDLLGTYDRTWLALNGQIVAYYLESYEGTQEDYKILGRVPAILNGTQKVDLVLCFTDENPDGEVLGARTVYDTQQETATQAKGLMELNSGDTLDFICDYYDYNQNFRDSYYLGEQMAVNGAIEVSNVNMENSSYIVAFRLTDIYNNHFWTPSIQ